MYLRGLGNESGVNAGARLDAYEIVKWNLRLFKALSVFNGFLFEYKQRSTHFIVNIMNIPLKKISTYWICWLC